MGLIQKYRFQILAISSIAVLSCVSLYFIKRSSKKDSYKDSKDSSSKKSSKENGNEQGNARLNRKTDDTGSELSEDKVKIEPAKESEPIHTSKFQNPPNVISSGLPQPDSESQLDIKTDEEKEFEELAKKAAKRFKGKQFDKAAEIYSQLLELLEKVPSKASEEITLYNNRSAMYEKMGQYDKCLEDCASALMLEHDHGKVRIRQARVLQAKGDLVGAIREVATLMHLNRERTTQARLKGVAVPDPQAPEILVKLLEEHSKETVGTIMAENKARKVLPSREAMLQSLLGFEMFSAAQKKAGNASSEGYNAEIDAMRAAAAISNSKLELAAELHKRARSFIKEIDFDGAFKDLTEIHELLETAGELDMYENQTELLSWLGMFWIHANEAEKAEAAFEKCCELEPLNAEHMAKKAGHLIDNEKVSEAKEILEEAEQLDEGCPDIYFVRCQLKLQTEDIQGAVEDLEKCVELRPKLIAAHHRLSLLALQQGNLMKAQECLDRGLESCGEDSALELMMHKGDILHATGNQDGAIEVFNKAIEYHPNRASPHLSKAVCLMQKQPIDISKVEECLEKAIEIDPKFNSCHFQLANVKMQSAKTEEERKRILDLFDKALETTQTEEELSFIVRAKTFCQASVDAAKSLGITEFPLV